MINKLQKSNYQFLFNLLKKFCFKRPKVFTIEFFCLIIKILTDFFAKHFSFVFIFIFKINKLEKRENTNCSNIYNFFVFSI